MADLGRASLVLSIWQFAVAHSDGFVEDNTLTFNQGVQTLGQPTP